MSGVAYNFVILAAAALGGAVNAVAGGGSLISFPALVWVGVPSINANATNTIALLPGSFGSMWGYRRELASTERRMYWLVLPSFVGGILGALLLRLTPALLFDRLVPALVFFATCLFMLQEPVQRLVGRSHHSERGTLWVVWAGVFQFVVGVYGGYFGAGIGILMLAALSVIGHDDIHQMNGFKNLLATCINGIAAVYFIWMGMVRWQEAVVMAIGAITGGVLGAHFARRLERATVRKMVIGIGLAMSAALLLRL